MERSITDLKLIKADPLPRPNNDLPIHQPLGLTAVCSSRPGPKGEMRAGVPARATAARDGVPIGIRWQLLHATSLGIGA